MAWMNECVMYTKVHLLVVLWMRLLSQVSSIFGYSSGIIFSLFHFVKIIKNHLLQIVEIILHHVSLKLKYFKFLNTFYIKMWKIIDKNIWISGLNHEFYATSWYVDRYLFLELILIICRTVRIAKLVFEGRQL